MGDQLFDFRLPLKCRISLVIRRVGIFLMRRAIRTTLVFPTINLSGRGDAGVIRCVLIYRRAPCRIGNARVPVGADQLFEAEFVPQVRNQLTYSIAAQIRSV